MVCLPINQSIYTCNVVFDGEGRAIEKGKSLEKYAVLVEGETFLKNKMALYSKKHLDTYRSVQMNIFYQKKLLFIENVTFFFQSVCIYIEIYINIFLNICFVYIYYIYIILYYIIEVEKHKSLGKGRCFYQN